MPRFGKILLGAATLALLAATAAEAGDCAALKGLKREGVTITKAEAVGPGWAPPKSLFTQPDPTAKTSFCRVVLTIEKEIQAEVWLPDVWNGRFQGVGNGGLTGALNYPAMAEAVRAGFATASTDTGHITTKGFFDIDWVAGHPERVENFGHRAHHLMAVTAKAVIAAYYGKPPTKNYYNGCSSGGWQGLTEAQRYPGDYDGIVAGAPAINFVRLQSNGFVQAWRSRKNPEGAISPPKLLNLAKAMVAQCDGIDGVKDGIITDPRQCKFDYAKIQCKDHNGPDCLTKAQIERAKTLYGPQKTRKGLKLYPGQAAGIVSLFAIAQEPGRDPINDTMMIAALKQKPKWTTATFDPDRDIPPMDKELGSTLNSANPDLSAFAARGGKLLLYHGWADNLLSPYNTLDYFGQVMRKTPDAANAVRLFMIPSMGHCGGGDGPNAFDSTAAIVNWVEKDEAPERLRAYHANQDGSIGMTRPICAEPKVAVYKGSGSASEAKNFECKLVK